MPKARAKPLRIIDLGIAAVATYRGIATIPGEGRFFVPEIILAADRATPGPAWVSLAVAIVWFIGAAGILLHVIAGGHRWSPPWLTGYPIWSLSLLSVLTTLWATSYLVGPAVGGSYSATTTLLFSGIAAIVVGHTLIEMQDAALVKAHRALGVHDV